MFSCIQNQTNESIIKAQNQAYRDLRIMIKNIINCPLRTVGYQVLDNCQGLDINYSLREKILIKMLTVQVFPHSVQYVQCGTGNYGKKTQHFLKVIIP